MSIALDECQQASLAEPQKFRNVIGGAQTEAPSYATVHNPANGDVVGYMPEGSIEDLDRAVDAAHDAFKTWSVTSDDLRKKACADMAQVIGEHAEELARLLTLEQGKPLNGQGSRFEIGGAQAWAGFAASQEVEPKVLQDNNEGKVVLHRRPIGVVGSITPWNWPVMLAMMQIAPAVRTGNTVVIKPSPSTPLSTLRMVELINTVLPAGVVNVVAGQNEIGAAMTAHPGIAKIAFTGSTPTGRKVMASAAGTLKRLTLELGGNDAGIVLPDADPAQIVEGIFWGAFINNGQTCAALKRLYVHDSLYDAVCDALVAYGKTVVVGDGMADDSVLGPIQNEMQFNKVRALVEDAKARGARILLGGEADADQKGFFFPVTLIADVDNGTDVVDEEQFGPVLPIIRYTDIDDVLARANDNPYGLGGSIWTRDVENGRALAGRLQCGTAWVNSHGGLRPDVPFGGVKQSGLGVAFGEEGLSEYTDIQVVVS